MQITDEDKRHVLREYRRGRKYQLRSPAAEMLALAHVYSGLVADDVLHGWDVNPRWVRLYGAAFAYSRSMAGRPAYWSTAPKWLR